MSTIDRVIVRRLRALLMATAFVAGCQAVPQPPGEADQTRPAGTGAITLPEGRVYSVSREESELRVVVYPDGPLVRFGHAHVIGGAVVDGRVVLSDELHESGLRLEVRVTDLEVDRPEWRVDEGFDPDMPESAVSGTRRNMLSEAVLDADAHPLIVIESLGMRGPLWQPDLDVRITLRGVGRELTVPVALEKDRSRLVATGRFTIRQSDFDMRPFSAMGGRLQVADEMLIRFRVVAVHAPKGALLP
jgi:polyisoprenoid-binding protein YceI